MINNYLQKKIDFALKLLRAIPNEEPLELSYSGGKDSDVILELAKMAGINFRAIYKNTSIDPPGTESYCKSKGVEIISPKTSFFDIVKTKDARHAERDSAVANSKSTKCLIGLYKACAEVRATTAESDTKSLKFAEYTTRTTK